MSRELLVDVVFWYMLDFVCGGVHLGKMSIPLTKVKI